MITADRAGNKLVTEQRRNDVLPPDKKLKPHCPHKKGKKKKLPGVREQRANHNSSTIKERQAYND